MRNIFLLALLACSTTEDVDVPMDTPVVDDSDGEPEVDTVDTVEGPGETADTGEPPAPVFVEGDEVVCADPGARGAVRWEKQLFQMPGSSSDWVQGGGVALTDLDGDGDLEIVQTTITTVWRHDLQDDGSLVSTEITSWPDVDDEMLGLFSTTPGDYDGDGDVDLHVSVHGGPDRLLSNDGTGVFTDVAAAAGLLGLPDALSAGAAWSDYDLDGDLDLAVSGYGLHLAGLDNAEWDPGFQTRLYRNLGDGTFEDRTADLPADVHSAFTFGVAFEDFDADGDIDLYLWQDIGFVLRDGNRLLRNDGTGVFVADDGAAGLDLRMSAMGLGIGDLNGDGIVDLSISGWKNQRLFVSSGPLWVESAAARGVVADTSRAQDVGWGNVMGDVDNDADLDILAAYGFLDITLAQHERDEPDALYLQNDRGNFEDAAPDWDFDDRRSTRGLALGDLNGDGWLDVVKASTSGMLHVHRSRCGSEAWLEVDLEGRGANPFAIGATVTVEGGGKVQTRRIYEGSEGYAATNAWTAHFGLGNATVVNRLEVAWPDGTVDEVFNVGVRRKVRATQPER